jgi:catechol 2,3-dioxygenase-like lactoylglutathione lyase family enzyme
MRVRPIHFVSDLAAAQRFYQALGLQEEAVSRVGDWVELKAAAGELGLHDSASADDGRGRQGVLLTFVADEPLEEVARRLQAAGFPPEGAVLDREWGRSLLVGGPDGLTVQIDERDRALYT